MSVYKFGVTPSSRKAEAALSPRPIYEIAAEISRSWRPMGVHAKPYVDAMYSLDKISDKFILDDGIDVVLRFLCNAGSWRGETARRVKAELKAMTKRKAVN
jgi:hypothetical protein